MPGIAQDRENTQLTQLTQLTQIYEGPADAGTQHLIGSK